MIVLHALVALRCSSVKGEKTPPCQILALCWPVAHSFAHRGLSGSLLSSSPVGSAGGADLDELQALGERWLLMSRTHLTRVV